MVDAVAPGAEGPPIRRAKSAAYACASGDISMTELAVGRRSL